MSISIYKCKKCGAVQTLPDYIEEIEPCMNCGSTDMEQIQ